MNKIKAYQNLEDCFDYFKNFRNSQMSRAIVLNDDLTLKALKDEYQSILSKKNLYKDMIDQAKTEEEIDNIIGSVNLSDVVNHDLD